MMRGELSTRAKAVRGVAIFAALSLAVGLLLARSMGTFDERVPATAQLDTAGGALEVGAEIKLDGVVVGKVVSIDPADRGVDLGLEFDPDQAEKVPGNATVRVLPISIFGAAYVELLRPKRPTGTISTDAVLRQDQSAQTIELGDLLEDTQELVDALGPAELATMLETFASTLSGKGEDIGEMIDTANRTVQRLQPLVPLLRQDIRLATTVMTMFSRMTPNLFTALDGVVAAGHTLVDMEKEFQQVLARFSSGSNAIERIVDKNQDALGVGLPLMRRVVHALYNGRGDIPGTFAAVIALADGAGPALSHGPFMRIDADLRLADEDDYGPGDCPSYKGLRGRGC